MLLSVMDNELVESSHLDAYWGTNQSVFDLLNREQIYVEGRKNVGSKDVTTGNVHIGHGANYLGLCLKVVTALLHNNVDN